MIAPVPRRVFALALYAAALQCSTNQAPSGSAGNTWQIDCVAVLGVAGASALMPVEAMPYSGAPRDKRIGELTDDELGKLCDFDTCSGQNGYRHDFCTDLSCGSMVGPFRLETVPLLASAMQTWYASSSHNPSREQAVQLYRQYFGACHVAQWEDCTREESVDPLGGISVEAPDCAERNLLCPSP